ncbi:MAG: glycosyltransferase family 4 protein [Cyanobacteria bacterium J06648_10]
MGLSIFKTNILGSRAVQLPEIPLSAARLLIVLKHADYRQALSSVFMPEDLYGQLSGQLSPVDLHILTAAVRWSTQVQEIAIFSCQSSVAYSESTYLKVRLFGSGVGESESTIPSSALTRKKQRLKAERQLVKQVSEFCPTHMVMCTESLPLLSWAKRNKIRTIALLFDCPASLQKRLQQQLSLAQRWRSGRLINQLNKYVDWVGGHGILASLRIEESGIASQKIIPWEWSQPTLAEPYPYKEIPMQKVGIELIYIGPLEAGSGIDDLLEATIRLHKNGYRISLQLIRDTLNQTSPVDSEETAWLEKRVQALGIAELVNVWAGLSPEQMLARVHAADLAVIPQPSRADPPLGVTLAMAAHTPIVACDHPSLESYLYHNANAVIFPTGNPRSMAHRIERVIGQPALYAQLSEASDLTLDKLKVPARWDELIECWLGDRPYDRQRLADLALTSGRYDPAS